MLETGQPEMFIVGFLIGLFSVVFPAIERLASVAYVYEQRG